jgi:hypothetical protein
VRELVRAVRKVGRVVGEGVARRREMRMGGLRREVDYQRRI